jgi:hypothetical protein
LGKARRLFRRVKEQKKENKMKKTVGLLSVFLLTAGVASAAVITWEAPVATTNVNNIITDGTLVEAGSWGTTGTNTVTVGSKTIDFVQMSKTDISPAANGVQTKTTLYDGTTGDATFDAILDSDAWSADSEVVRTLTLDDLKIGQQYQVQFFVSDDRSAASQASTMAFATENGNSVTLTSSDIGSFTADATTQEITLTPSAQLILNAYVLQSIP